MAYPFQQPDITQEEAEDWRLVREYAALTASAAWQDLSALIDNAVQASLDTLAKNPSQDPQIAFGLLKRWQERKAMKELIDSQLLRYQQLMEQLKEQDEHSSDDTRSNDSQ